MADALSYGIKQYKPDLTIDIATLTGACIIALGHRAAGLMTNTPSIVSDISKAGNDTYERVWHMPLYSDYEEQLKSEIADLKNIGGRPAGSITAGKFLEKFVAGKPWMHIDIAGTAFIETVSNYLPKGATGFGVRLLTAFIKDWISDK